MCFLSNKHLMSVQFAGLTCVLTIWEIEGLSPTCDHSILAASGTAVQNLGSRYGNMGCICELSPIAELGRLVKNIVDSIHSFADLYVTLLCLCVKDSDFYISLSKFVSAMNDRSWAKNRRLYWELKQISGRTARKIIHTPCITIGKSRRM